MRIADVCQLRIAFRQIDMPIVVAREICFVGIGIRYEILVGFIRRIYAKEFPVS